MIALVDHTFALGGGASSAINTTGATLLIAGTSLFSGSPSMADSKSNSGWTPLTSYSTGVYVSTLLYVANPTVGSGHTFTLSGSFPALWVAAFSGVTLSSPFDVENGSTGTVAIQTGSVTPSQNNELVITVLTVATTTGAAAIDNGFTILDGAASDGGSYVGGALAYKVQTTAAAVNPTWSYPGITGDTRMTAGIATFKASGGATAALSRQANLATGSGGPFFSNPLGKLMDNGRKIISMYRPKRLAF